METLTLNLLLVIKSGKDPSVLRIRWYESSQILKELEELLDEWQISIKNDRLVLTEKGSQAIEWINTKMWNRWAEKRISVESWSQIPKLKDGELYIPQEHEVDF